MMNESIRQLTAQIVSAYLGNHTVLDAEIPPIIRSVHKALAAFEKGPPEIGLLSHNQTPAVDPKRSVFKDHIVCLEDGLSFKTIKRHIEATHGMTVEEYKVKWGLPADYPIVATDYGKLRSKMAKKIGLGKR